MNAALNILSLAFFGLAAVAYGRKHRITLSVAAGLFFPTCGVSLITTWWPLSPLVSLVLTGATLGVALVMLALFAVDVIWAPFALEMTYLTLLCWFLCPLAIALDFTGALLRFLLA